MFPRNGWVVAAIGATLMLLAVACQARADGGPEPRAGAATQELKILQWNHFVPRYDEWFDAFAVEWGEENGVNVIVDHVDIGELGFRAAAELAASEGHDLIEHLSPPAQYEPDVLDLTEVDPKN